MNNHFKILLILLTFLAGCQPVVTTSRQAVPSYIQSFLIKNGIENVTFIPNEKDSRVLCLYITGDGMPWIKYSVYNLESQEEIYSNEAIANSVEWLNNNEIIIKGLSRVDPNSHVIIDVISKETRRN